MMAVIRSTRNTAIYHRYDGIGGIRRYVSRMRCTHDWKVQPYMVTLYANSDGSGELAITFMDKKQAECHFMDYAEMVATIKRWQNLRKCSISEFSQIDDKTYQLERIWGDV